MLDRFFRHDTAGTLKALTLEWRCPDCEGLNFRILTRGERNAGSYDTRCRYCRSKFRVNYPRPDNVIDGEDEFMDRISQEDFTESEKTDMVRDFAEIASLRVDRAQPALISGKVKVLEDKIAFAKRRRR
jgi:hypothetical protein